MKNVIFIYFILCSFALHAQEKKLIWDYPLKPGMEEWNKLKTEKERIAAVQVPEEVLAKASAEDLVLLAVSFPRFGYYTAFNTPQTGFDVMRSRYNVFRALCSRQQQEIGKNLIALYKDAGMSGFEKTPVSNDFWTIKFDFIELMLAQKEIISTMTPSDKYDLLLETKNKISQKGCSEAFNSFQDLCSTTFIIGRVLESEKMIDSKQAELKEFLTHIAH